MHETFWLENFVEGDHFQAWDTDVRILNESEENTLLWQEMD
jgi:hypothetical protein